MRKTLGCIRRADERFDMIQANDHVAVGVSGGKDSLLLLNALALYRKFCRVPFTLEALSLGMGWPGVDFSGVAAFCEHLDVPFTFVETDIKEVVFDIRKEENPCALCAKLRRGALNNLAKARGCNKLALGHHREDVAETFLMSMLYEGRLNLFAPVTYLNKVDITVIRPMVFVPERHIIGTAKKLNLPIVKNPCPADGHTNRQRMKNLLTTLSDAIRDDAAERIVSAIANTEQYNLWAGTKSSKTSATLDETGEG
ncbi:MAG: tRNA 2-thiocytidine biosynthesis TtcA family protein [Christensenellales bacterium]|jgi:tRNA 2-thiocytidine biosynthesis protein TtcA